ncbi:MAG: serine/threonine protein kinase [Gammaproteobacteria bacterium]|nr:serine/threonine protein kinase [Gammaproteobacteria bacterium]
METETQKLDAQPSTTGSLKPEIQIPGYKIMRELGHGGMAHVYLAVQESFGREVALKILSPHLTDDEQFSKRFLREARIVSQLNHPNIVTVFDAGKQGKYHYMSMEYIPGKELKQLKSSISRKEAIRIVKDIARALDFAGSKGIVHRDVKPENIMIHQTDNRVILMDFGIAHGDDVTHGMTQTGKAIGTPHYMSPEQTKGLKVDHRSDIYSLGVVLFQLLAGYLPFEADSAVAVGIKHLTAPIPLLPAGLEIFQPIVNHCLSKEPQHRYQKAAELITALDKIGNEQLDDIDAKARSFKQAGANSDAETQVSDIVISKKRKIPDIVFPSSNKTTIKGNIEDAKEKSTVRRNVLFLLLISSMAWAGYEKQKELSHFWGYEALPKIAEIFPNLFPESYLKYWADKAETQKTSVTPVITQGVPETTSPENQGQVTSSVEKNTTDTSKLNLTPAAENIPVKKELTRDEKVDQLKTGLKDHPENASKLASIYKEMLIEMPQSPIARKGIQDLREWYMQQIHLAFDTEDAERARQLIDMMKQSFPRATQNKRFMRLENKIALLEKINTHLNQAEKYFSAGAVSKPIGKNALDEIQKVLILSPGNEDAKNFINKIALSYIEKTTQLHQQGNMQNALLMIEEGIAALNNHPALVNKRKSLKDQITYSKNIAALFKQAKKYEAAGQLIKPIAYNAYDIYKDILKNESDNLQAQAGLKSIHQQVAKDITASIQNGDLINSTDYLQAAIQRYGRTSLLANVQLKLNDALEAVAPKIETIQLSHLPIKKLIATTPIQPEKLSLKETQTLRLENMLYVGFNFINFNPTTTWLDATLIDSTREKNILQKPVVVSTQLGEHFFEIKLPASGLKSSMYKVELKLKDKILISKSFLVTN